MDETIRRAERAVQAAPDDAMAGMRLAAANERTRDKRTELTEALARVMEHAGDERLATEWLRNIEDNLGVTIPARVTNHVRDKVRARWQAYISRVRPDEVTRWTYSSGEATVSLRFNERCAHDSCQCRGGALHGRGCYRGTVRAEAWRGEAVVWRFAHLHLSPDEQSRLAVDSPEAIMSACRSALVFGSNPCSDDGERVSDRARDVAEAISNAYVRNASTGEPVLDCERFDNFTGPGSYPILYVAHDGGTFCGNCAPRYVERRRGDVFYEGSPETCDDCGTVIESAYGNPDEPEDEESE